MAPMYDNVAVNAAVNVDPYVETIPATAPHKTPVIEGIDISRENFSWDISNRLIMSVTHALKKLSKNVGPDKNKHNKICSRYLCEIRRGSTMYFINLSKKDRWRILSSVKFAGSIPE
jgi:pyruvate/oxaloacetate carboxyltransferase